MSDLKDGARVVSIGIAISDMSGVSQLETLLRGLEGELNASIIVCATRGISLAEVRQLEGLKSVHRVHQGQALHPVAGDICIIDEGLSLHLDRSVLRVDVPSEAQESRSLLDDFFIALATSCGSRTIAVLLGKRGTDGLLGLRPVYEEGGVTIVERPVVEHPTVPRDALSSGEIDFIVTVEDMPAIIRKSLRFSDQLSLTNDSSDLRRDVIENIPLISEILREQTNHNFKDYKTSTLVRRIERRMRILRIDSVESYVKELRAREEERSSLFRDLLISVTSFFRDESAFDSLARNVLPELFVEGRAEPVRIWVPGCATGQEAYSMAILCDEYCASMKRPPEVQILATDIDTRALTAARKGVYPAGIASQVSPERLDRYFVRKAGRFHVSKEIREKCLFSVHNLISDPPFSRLDLISCRNILIYLGMHLQIKLIPLFHFAMQPDGFLLLGPSESLSGNRELFTEIDLRNRLWKRRKSAVDPPTLLANHETNSFAAAMPLNLQKSEADLQELGQRIILGEFAPEWAIVGEDSQVLTTSPGIGEFLRIGGGFFRNHIVDLVTDELKTAIRTTLNDAMKVHRRVDHGNVSVRVPHGLQPIRITVQPMPRMGAESTLYMVVFHKDGVVLSPGEALLLSNGDSSDALIRRLELELSSTRNDLEKSIQELEAANEELKSFNEELLSMNEELQSANEELEASRAEVDIANLSLVDAREEIENLLASTNIATIFLDRNGIVKNFTAAAREIYNLIDSDVGRPLWHLTHRISNMPTFSKVDDVESGTVREIAVMRDDGRWFSRRELPYRNRKGQTEGIVLTFADITELRANEARSRIALEAGKMGTWQWHSESKRLVLDAQTRLFLHIDSPDEYVSEEMAFQHLVVEYRNSLRHRLIEVISNPSEHSFRHDVCVRWPENEETRWLAFVGAVAIADGAHHSGYITGVVFDFTERKQIELRLREREHFSRTVFENSPDCFKVLDADGHLLMMNRRGCQLLEVDNFEDIAGKFWCSLWPAEVQSILESAIQTAKSGGTAQFQLFCPTVKGTQKYWDVILVGVPDATGGIGQIISVSRDITAIRNSEQETIETTARLQSAIEVAGLGTVTVNYADQTATIDANAAKILGLEQPCVMSRLAFHQLFLPEDQERLDQQSRASLAAVDTSGFSTEARRRTSTGTRVVNIRKRNSFSEDGTPLRGLMAIQDITERKTYELSLQSAREIAEAATKSRGEFLANMSHEIRTPMTAILGHVDILAENTTDPDNLQCVDTIRRNGRFLLEIINDILDLSRIDAGQLRLNHESVVIAQLLADIRSLMDVRAAEKNLLLVFEFRTRVPAQIESDAVRLRQVLLNLIGNAIKFTRVGSVRVQMRYLPESRELRFDVIDTGIGISEAQLRKLFVPFQQADDSTTREFGGTGLGLAISRRLARALSGDISVVSEPGVGSTFSLTMACPDCDSKDLVVPDLQLLQPVASPPDNVHIHANVLIVDDRRDIRSLAQHFVEKAGGKVMTATNGQEAVDFLLSNSREAVEIDIVLLDMQMPVMDGYEAVRKLRESGFTRPVIALTANAMKEDRDRCLSAGCTDYTTKPLDAGRLIALIADLCRANRDTK